MFADVDVFVEADGYVGRYGDIRRDMKKKKKKYRQVILILPGVFENDSVVAK